MLLPGCPGPLPSCCSPDIQRVVSAGIAFIEACLLSRSCMRRSAYSVFRKAAGCSSFLEQFFLGRLSKGAPKAWKVSSTEDGEKDGDAWVMLSALWKSLEEPVVISSVGDPVPRISLVSEVVDEKDSRREFLAKRLALFGRSMVAFECMPRSGTLPGVPSLSMLL